MRYACPLDVGQFINHGYSAIVLLIEGMVHSAQCICRKRFALFGSTMYLPFKFRKHCLAEESTRKSSSEWLSIASFTAGSGFVFKRYSVSKPSFSVEATSATKIV